MHEPLILAVDQGTSGTKVLLFDSKGEVRATRYKEHKQYYPQPGWVEHDPLEIWSNVAELCADVIKEAAPGAVQAIAITNQRETVVAWDRHTGKPLAPAVVWQCRRSVEICKELQDQGLSQVFRRKTGLTLDPYFSGTKIKWLLDKMDLQTRAEQGDVCFGTVDSWLVWNFTGGKVFATDYSNASRTLLLNINDLNWDQELLEVLGVPKHSLPELRPSSHTYGLTAGICGIPAGIPIAGVIGDSQGALMGQSCFKPGMAKATYGTGTSMMVYAGTETIVPPEGMVLTVAWSCNDSTAYALEGVINATGAIVKWLRDGLQLIDDVSKTEELAKSLHSNEGVYLVPAFTGLGAPYWDMEARALICGVTYSTSRSHLIRAGLESIAYQVKDVVDLVSAGGGPAITALRVDGGASSNRFLMQFQSDILGVDVLKPEIEELSALGAAYLAGLEVGVWQDFDEIAELWKATAHYRPTMPEERRTELYAGWKDAVQRALTQQS